MSHGVAHSADSASMDVPVAVRVQFAHASAQSVAAAVGADVLHIKGATVDPETNPGRPGGTDADVLVRPAHVRRFMKGLVAAGWFLWCDFEEGSRFAHAASLHHTVYGMLDVHQNFPGLHNAPADNFERLWQRRIVRPLAGVPCAVPDRLGERLILLVHAARTPHATIDVTNHWTNLEAAERADLVALADTLQARVGLALAAGEVDQLHETKHLRELPLWQEFGEDSQRLAEWRARWLAAPTASDRARLVLRAPRVNRFVLEQRLGRRPTRADVRREWGRRALRALQLLRPRRGRGSQ